MPSLPVRAAERVRNSALSRRSGRRHREDMRNTLRLTLLALAVSSTFAGLAHGQGAPATPARTPITFIDMEEMMMHARISRPSVAFVDARRQAKFERLLKLRHEVLGALRTTASDASLR